MIYNNINEVEEVIYEAIERRHQSFYPCLICSIYAIGQMPLKIDLVSRQGEIVNQVFAISHIMLLQLSL